MAIFPTLRQLRQPLIHGFGRCQFPFRREQARLQKILSKVVAVKTASLLLSFNKFAATPHKHSTSLKCEIYGMHLMSFLSRLYLLIIVVVLAMGHGCRPLFPPFPPPPPLFHVPNKPSRFCGRKATCLLTLTLSDSHCMPDPMM